MAGAIFGQVSFSGDLPSPETVREGLSRVTGLAVAVETQAAQGTEQGLLHPEAAGLPFRHSEVATTWTFSFERPDRLPAAQVECVCYQREVYVRDAPDPSNRLPNYLQQATVAALCDLGGQAPLRQAPYATWSWADWRERSGPPAAPTDVVASAHLFGCLLTIATLVGAGVLAWLLFGEG